MLLKNKVVVVTGAGDGIGRGIALAFARAGADVAACTLSSAQVLETKRQVEELGRRCVAEAFDASDEKAVVAFLDHATRELGAPTVLIPTAAVMPVTPVDQIDATLIDDCYSAKFRSAVLFCKHCVPVMKTAGGGNIVFMASVTGNVGFPFHSVYGAMNAALQGLARGLAIELAQYNIRVNSVSPGTVDSPMLHRYIEQSGEDPVALRKAFDAFHPRGKIASIEEVANTFLFLASDLSANITGEDIRCDGGFSFKGGQAHS